MVRFKTCVVFSIRSAAAFNALATAVCVIRARSTEAVRMLRAVSSSCSIACRRALASRSSSQTVSAAITVRRASPISPNFPRNSVTRDSRASASLSSRTSCPSSQAMRYCRPLMVTLMWLMPRLRRRAWCGPYQSPHPVVPRSRDWCARACASSPANCRVPAPAASGRRRAPGCGLRARSRRGRNRGAARRHAPARRVRTSAAASRPPGRRRRCRHSRNRWRGVRSCRGLHAHLARPATPVQLRFGKRLEEEVYVAESTGATRLPSYAPIDGHDPSPKWCPFCACADLRFRDRAQATFPSLCAFPCLGLPEPRCYQRPTPRPPRPQSSAHASVAYHQQAPHFRRIFIMTQVDHTRMANAIRGLAMDAVEKAKSGHPGLPMGAADMATVLFTQFLKFDAADPKWPDRDRFVLSAGHGSMLLYALLYLTGNTEMTLDQIRNFRQLGSKTPGHPENFETSGVETTTGPLGQGIATAVGMALAEKMLAAEFSKKVVNHHTYVIASDGDLMEGIAQEAIARAGVWGLNDGSV